MTPLSGIVALDGHDGAGKTTLARALAEHLGGVYVRPFHGQLGAALLAAATRRDFDRIVTLGEEGLKVAVEGAGPQRPLVLDRGWITVASLVGSEAFDAFASRWRWWIPTALCWADLPTTLARLARRDEGPETISSHKHYLTVYRDLADRTGSVIVRTDIDSERICLEKLIDWSRRYWNVQAL